MTGHLALGLPIPVKNFFIHPFTVAEVVGLEDKYYLILSPLLVLREDLETEGLESLSFVQLLALNSVHSEKFKKQLIASLSLVTKEKVSFDGEYYVINGSSLTGETWGKIREIVVEQNVLDEKSLRKKQAEEEFNPGNEKAKEMQAKIEKTRKAVNKAKSKKSDDKSSYLGDALNNFCSKSPNINLLEIRKYTLFMFWNQYGALINTDRYEKETQAIFAGADAKKMKAPHWASQKMKKEER